jgi:uncharacterized protein
MEKWPGTEGKDSSSSSSNMDYWIISTTDSKGNKASIGGGMMTRQGPHHQHITNFLDVNSVDESSSKIEKLGGKVVVSKMAVPGMGYFAVCHIPRITALVFGNLMIVQSDYLLL